MKDIVCSLSRCWDCDCTWCSPSTSGWRMYNSCG